MALYALTSVPTEVIVADTTLERFANLTGEEACAFLRGRTTWLAGLEIEPTTKAQAVHITHKLRGYNGPVAFINFRLVDRSHAPRPDGETVATYTFTPLESIATL